MAERSDGRVLIAREWDRAAREVERAPFRIEDDFDLMRRFDVRGVLEWMRGGDHFNTAIVLHFPNESIEQLRIRQWLIALDIDDVFVAAILRDLCDPICSAAMSC